MASQDSTLPAESVQEPDPSSHHVLSEPSHSVVVEHPVSWSKRLTEVLPCSSVHSLVPSSHHLDELPSERVSTLQPVASS